MLIYILLVFLNNNLINAYFDESAENRYIDRLAEKEKKELLERVGRRVLEEVKSGETVHDIIASREITDEQLNQHNDFVGKLIKEESENLRRHFENNETDSIAESVKTVYKNITEIEEAILKTEISEGRKEHMSDIHTSSNDAHEVTKHAEIENENNENKNVVLSLHKTDRDDQSREKKKEQVVNNRKKRENMRGSNDKIDDKGNTYDFTVGKKEVEKDKDKIHEETDRILDLTLRAGKETEYNSITDKTLIQNKTHDLVGNDKSKKNHQAESLSIEITFVDDKNSKEELKELYDEGKVPKKYNLVNASLQNNTFANNISNETNLQNIDKTKLNKSVSDEIYDIRLIEDSVGNKVLRKKRKSDIKTDSDNLKTDKILQESVTETALPSIPVTPTTLVIVKSTELLPNDKLILTTDKKEIQQKFNEVETTTSKEIQQTQIINFDANDNETVPDSDLTPNTTGSTTEEIVKARTVYISGYPEDSNENMTLTTPEDGTFVAYNVTASPEYNIKNTIKNEHIDAYINISFYVPNISGRENASLSENETSKITKNVNKPNKDIYMKAQSNEDKEITKPIKEIEDKTAKQDKTKEVVENSKEIAESSDLKNFKDQYHVVTTMASLTTSEIKEKPEIFYTVEASDEIQNVTEKNFKQNPPSQKEVNNDATKTVLRSPLMRGVEVKHNTKNVKKIQAPRNEYVVWELLPGEEPFVKQEMKKKKPKPNPKISHLLAKQKRKKEEVMEFTEIEQPNYAPVYNFAPENAYYNPRNIYTLNADDDETKFVNEQSNESDINDLEKIFDYDVARVHKHQHNVAPKSKTSTINTKIYEDDDDDGHYRISEDYYYGEFDRKDDVLDDLNLILRSQKKTCNGIRCKPKIVTFDRDKYPVPPNSDEHEHAYNALLNKIPSVSQTQQAEAIMHHLGYFYQTPYLYKHKFNADSYYKKHGLVVNSSTNIEAIDLLLGEKINNSRGRTRNGKERSYSHRKHLYTFKIPWKTRHEYKQKLATLQNIFNYSNIKNNTEQLNRNESLILNKLKRTFQNDKENSLLFTLIRRLNGKYESENRKRKDKYNIKNIINKFFITTDNHKIKDIKKDPSKVQEDVQFWKSDGIFRSDSSEQEYLGDINDFSDESSILNKLIYEIVKQKPKHLRESLESIKNKLYYLVKSKLKTENFLPVQKNLYVNLKPRRRKARIDLMNDLIQSNNEALRRLYRSNNYQNQQEDNEKTVNFENSANKKSTKNRFHDNPKAIQTNHETVERRGAPRSTELDELTSTDQNQQEENEKTIQKSFENAADEKFSHSDEESNSIHKNSKAIQRNKFIADRRDDTDITKLEMKELKACLKHYLVKYIPGVKDTGRKVRTEEYDISRCALLFVKHAQIMNVNLTTLLTHIQYFLNNSSFDFNNLSYHFNSKE